MDKKIYEKLTRQARIQIQKTPRKVMIKVKKIYDKAADDLAKIVESLPADSFSLQVQTSTALISELNQASENIATALSDTTLEYIDTNAVTATSVDKSFMVGAGLDEQKVADIIQSVNQEAVIATVSRVWQNGYTFSQNVWKVGESYQDDIKSVLSSGIAQGRDPFQIAKDIQVYTKDGKVKLMKSYGKLKKGVKGFSKRIPKSVDYRATRLVKTEIYTSLREVEAMSAETNPGTTGFYNWIRQQGAAHYDCECPDLAANGPYLYEDIPGTPHPNCACYVQAILRDQREFTADLAKWANGEDVDYLDDWAAKQNY